MYASACLVAEGRVVAVGTIGDDAGVVVASVHGSTSWQCGAASSVEAERGGRA